LTHLPVSSPSPLLESINRWIGCLWRKGVFVDAYIMDADEMQCSAGTLAHLSFVSLFCVRA
jgi:hypothetical protein